MGFSRGAAAAGRGTLGPARARRTRPGPVALATGALLLAAAGCAHVAASPPEPAPVSAGRQTLPADSRPAPRAEPVPRTQAPSSGASASLDPSEVMTPEELATIPDPLPGNDDATRAAPSSGPAEPAEPRSDGTGGDTSNGAVWRVQILATPDRTLADRVAAEAVDRLGTTSRVDFEGSLYKVRLGAFATESAAQGLRERAIEMGYPGAFRVKSVRPAND